MSRIYSLVKRIFGDAEQNIRPNSEEFEAYGIETFSDHGIILLVLVNFKILVFFVYNFL